MDAVESSLWQAFQADRSPATRNALFEYFLPLLKRIAWKRHSELPASAGLDVDDLVSDGSFGLIQAIERFDISRGLKFGTMATIRILGAIADGLRRRDWVPRLERSRQRAEGVTVPVFMSIQVKDDDDPEWEPSSRDPDPVDDFWDHMARGLTSRERQILIWHWRDELTQHAIAERLQTSPSLISKIMSDIMHRLRQKEQSTMVAESLHQLIRLLHAWAQSPTVDVPADLRTAIEDADRVITQSARFQELSPCNIVASQIVEWLYRRDNDDPWAVQPDGLPGPRLWAPASLLVERVAAAGDRQFLPMLPLFRARELGHECGSIAVRVPDVSERPRRESPIPAAAGRISVPVPPKKESALSTFLELMNQLNNMSTEAIDKEIEALQTQIGVLKKLKALKDGAKGAKGGSGRATKAEMEELADSIHAQLKANGAAKPSKLAKDFERTLTTIQRLLEKNPKRFKKLADGSFSAI